MQLKQGNRIYFVNTNEDKERSINYTNTQSESYQRVLNVERELTDYMKQAYRASENIT